ncbi:MAG: BamA/TamA family outer membrane protein [Gammaproteobacteria bacterium]|uniref:patatin-like phospholipase family protein n=1 Tax=Pseudomaricurvus alcaniphilus TaxID=1166482 RepID=UPI001409B822|nr:patatin-like phospholipase family protein [Pseudomaricurvus alcaniphilus]MBR9909745.1 BamA/TamA family outer membrane protein [Gammaproteobacteria bacterium]NHN38464.1 BamA/TamA family outer membrane protein [Pseudomaricurvus alcaniphilus]
MTPVIIRAVLFSGLLLFASCSALSAATHPAERPRVALVLSGGGALGLAHIGVLKALEELRVPVDCVVGTSMGAMVGGIYAAGMAPVQMETVLAETDISRLFDDRPPREQRPQLLKKDDYRPLFDFAVGYKKRKVEMPSGAASGYKFELFIKQAIGIGQAQVKLDFDRLPTPYRAVATDLESGAMQVFESGSLSRVMRASMSLPAIVEPVEIDGRVYIDGGLVRNLPVDVGRELCGDVVIAVNIATPAKTREQIRGSLAVARQAITLLTIQNINRSIAELSDDDVLLEPDLEEFHVAAFAGQFEIIERGYEAAMASRAALEQLALAPEQHRHWLAAREVKKAAPLRITSIAANTDDRMVSRVIMRDIHTGLDEQFDLKQLHDNIISAYGRGDYSYIDYSVVPDGEVATVLIDASRKPWGPGYLKFGLGAATDFSSPTHLNLAASYRRTWVNSLGGEWRGDLQLGYESVLGGEFIQPLQIGDGAFLSLAGALRRYPVQLYAGQSRIGEVLIKGLDLEFTVGAKGLLGEMRFGPFMEYMESEPDFGFFTEQVDEEELYQAGLKFSSIYDQLDSYAFPSRGLLGRLEIKAASRKWQSENEFIRTQLLLHGAKSYGRHTLAAKLEWGENLGTEEPLPVYNRFKLGGPQRLAGHFIDQFTGSRYNLASLSYYRRYSTLPSQLGQGLYTGAALNLGRIDDPLMLDPWGWIGSASVFWGADTVLGTALIAYGWSDNRQSSWYITLGQNF